MKNTLLALTTCTLTAFLWTTPNAWAGQRPDDSEPTVTSEDTGVPTSSDSEDASPPDAIELDALEHGLSPDDDELFSSPDADYEFLEDELSLGDALLEEFRDASFERYVDLRLVGDAFAARDASLLADVALLLLEGERILLRSHHSGLTAQALMRKAAAMAGRTQDEDTLQRLVKAADAIDDDELTAEIQAAEKLSGESRVADPALALPVETTAIETFIEIREILKSIEDAALLNDKQTLSMLREELTRQDHIPDAQREALVERIDTTTDSITDETVEDDALQKLTDELVTKLTSTSRVHRAEVKIRNLTNRTLNYALAERESGSTLWRSNGWFQLESGRQLTLKSSQYVFINDGNGNNMLADWGGRRRSFVIHPSNRFSVKHDDAETRYYDNDNRTTLRALNQRGHFHRIFQRFDQNTSINGSSGKSGGVASTNEFKPCCVQ